MAFEMLFWPIDNATIDRLRNTPGLLAGFLQDNEPPVSGPNHRNVDMFHFILNGTEDHVTGIKGIFENLDDACAIAIGEDAVAITSETARQLLNALRKLDATTIQKRWSHLIRRRGLVEDENEPGLDEAERMRRRKLRAEEENDPYFHKSFAYLTQLCEQAASQNQGLLWRWQ